MAKRKERDETQRSRDATLEAELRNERQPQESDWRMLDDYIKPGRLRLSTSEGNRANKRNTSIINETATIAHRDARAGLHSGMSSPARPWLLMEAPDPDLNDYGPVKEWCHLVTQRMLRIFAVSNLYKMLPVLYGDELQFGIGAMVIDEDEDDFMRCYVPPPGSYWLAMNARLMVDTYLRELSLSVRQMLERYGDKKVAGTPEFWEPFSKTIKNLADRNNYEARVDVMHLIAPNNRWDRKHYEARYKRFRSCCYEQGSSEDKYLKESGYDEFPVIAPRWEATGEDVYGRGPGLDALGGAKAIQTLERNKLNALKKMIDPPLTGPASLANKKVSLLSGDVTAFDVREGMQGLRPIHEVRTPIAEMAAEIREHEKRLRSAFFSDFLLMVTQMEGVQPRNQIEMLARKEEKMMLLGPVLENQNDEGFDPMTDRVFDMMERLGLIPEPPPELQGMPLKVEYISILHQAQKLIGSSGLERTSGFVGNLVAVYPDAGDKFDYDEAIDEYADQQGVPPKVIRSTEDANKRRKERAEAAQKQQAVEQMGALAQGAKTLADTDLSTPNALTAIAGGLAA